ncbi:DUF4126 domain-containing protein [Trueperella pecoris]|uniref:DUF4126 domain-containing protein n=1 Tax=Trueperella pecoris TaxID=2733571 RepID=A0A7M1R156_9ACTO|nr:DUF4126 domain-containing protein [Trueperella pecoris]QOR47883.1 DUF4126 domain-containing protein [Trueperella pecoris]
MDLLSATGLAGAAGLNAYIPLLIFGLLARFTDAVTLPSGWQWLADPVLLTVVALLLVVELIADKIPVVDTVNDVIQTAIRPASGGLVFASGLDAYGGTSTVSSGSVFSEPKTWVAIGAGVVIAFIMHALKASARPAVNAGTLGTGAAVMSAAEDTTSVGLSLAAIFVPILAGLAIVVVLGGFALLAYKATTWNNARKRGKGSGLPYEPLDPRS